MTLNQRRLRLIFLSAVSAVGLLAGPATGASGERVERLRDALVSVYNENPQILAERARQRATDEELAIANSGWRPRVIINGSASYNEDYSDNFSTDAWNANIVATQPLFQGGEVLAQREVAKARIRGGRALLSGIEAQVFLATITAYMDVVRDTAVYDISNNQVEVLRRELQASQDRFDVGEITRTDVAQAQARLSGAETNRIAASAQLEASRNAYARLLGHLPGRLESQPAMPRLPRSEKDAIDSAMVLNPQLLTARENQLAAEANIDVAISRLLPRVDLQAEYSRGEANPDSILTLGRDTSASSVGIVGTVPLYQGGGEYAAIRQAKQTNSQTIMLATQAEREALEDVTNAWAALEASRAAIVSAQDQVRANEIAYEGVRQEAEVGARTTLDVLNAEQELLNARVTFITNQRNEYVAAYALMAAMGRLSAAELGLPVEIYDPVAHGDEVAGKLIGVGD